MSDNSYLKRLEKDLPAWHQQGWVSEDGARAILNSVRQNPAKSRFPLIVGFLGAILIAASVMSFVAANWEDIPRIWKLILLLGAMAASYVCAWRLVRNNHSAFADAALLVGLTFFGGAIMLVGQIYHIGNHYPDGLLVWAIGALATAFLTSSRSAIVVGLGTALFWSGTEIMEFNWDFHWPFLALWAAFTGLVALWKWGTGYRLVILTIMVWLSITIFKYAMLADWNPMHLTAISVIFMVSVFAASHLVGHEETPVDGIDRWLGFGLSAKPWALVLILGCVGLLRLFIDLAGKDAYGDQLTGTEFTIWFAGMAGLGGIAAIVITLAIIRKKLRPLDAFALVAAALLPTLFALFPTILTTLTPQILSAIVAIGLSIWAMEYGQKYHYSKAVNLGLITFGLVALDIYFATFGSLLDTALFFLLGGILLLVLAWFLTRLRSRFNQPEEGTAS